MKSGDRHALRARDDTNLVQTQKHIHHFFIWRRKKKFTITQDNGIVSYEMVTEIDLHGFRLEEAEAAVMKFVDQLYYHGETDGRIIHGLGIIAERLPQWLKNYPYVKHFERAPLIQGVTLVFLAVA